jgi:NarL family two-component system response regulator LiaR
MSGTLASVPASNQHLADPIRILIADDHPVVRQGLGMILTPRNNMRVVGEAANGREAVELARKLRPDVIVMDLLMPELQGQDAIAQIVAEDPQARILVLASFAEPAKVVAAVQTGALGYVLKASSPDELFDAIRNVYRGNLFLPRGLANAVTHPQSTAADLAQLTERETDVLRLLAQGQSNQAIAQTLSISSTTVRSHVSSILLKLQVANRTQAALIAREHQLA